MECVIDIQGFHNSENKFIIKEASLVLMHHNTIANWIAALLYPFSDLGLSAQIFNNAQTSFLHGLEWFDGDISSRQLYTNLRAVTRILLRKKFMYNSCCFIKTNLRVYNVKCHILKKLDS